MRKLWARIGVEITLTDEEYNNFMKKAYGNSLERDKSKEFFLGFLKNPEKVQLTGESYLPGIGKCNGYENPYDGEIFYEF